MNKRQAKKINKFKNQYPYYKNYRNVRIIKRIVHELDIKSSLYRKPIYDLNIDFCSLYNKD